MIFLIFLCFLVLVVNSDSNEEKEKICVMIFNHWIDNVMLYVKTADEPDQFHFVRRLDPLEYAELHVESDTLELACLNSRLQFVNQFKVPHNTSTAWVMKCTGSSLGCGLDLGPLAGRCTGAVTALDLVMDGRRRRECLLDENVKRRDQDNRARLHINKHHVHNELVPHLTEAGFKLTRAPAAAFSLVRRFYLANGGRHFQSPEQLYFNNAYIDNICFKQFLPDFMQMPEPIRQRFLEAVQPVVEQWVQQPLDPMAVGGVRLYRDRTNLRMHVDRLSTHAVSVIMIVDEHGLAANFTLRVVDHQDQVHEVVMHPGDLLLYESATVIHGRPTPMVGQPDLDGIPFARKKAVYANCYAHFRTKNWPEFDGDFLNWDG